MSLLERRRSRGLSRSRGGMALVITLSLLLLVTILVLTFFSQATLNRQISFASAAQVRADNLSETALQTIVNDLREEMAAGSILTAGTAGKATFVPSTNLNMVPQRLGSTGLTNLVKRSVGGSPAWTGVSYRYAGPIRSFSGNSTTNLSANGRYLPVSYWLSPKLLTAAETNSLQAPDWILITRQGPITNAVTPNLTDFSNKNPTNANYVIGRFAYTVYDIGGLLDANVVGYPSTASVSFSDISRKGNLGLISITNLPDVSQAKADALINWRLPASNYAANGYANYLRTVAATNGFLRPPSGGAGFLTRQDLIKYASLNGLTNALPYLNNFIREKNTPSWRPSTQTGSTIDYAGQSESSGMANRNLANLRGLDGLALIKSRFDLDRLAWLTYKGPSASLATSDPFYNANGTPANILKYFGLTWDSSPYSPSTERGQQWIYTSPDSSVASNIKTLGQVAVMGREPDFFELLKAAMLSGSLGLYSSAEKSSAADTFATAGNNGGSVTFRKDLADSSRIFNEISDYQILAIGANVLTQYTSDGYPQAIQTPGGNVVGVKSMPYLFSMGLDAYRPVTIANRDTTFFWLRFTVWNPYRNNAIATPNVAPVKFRIKPFAGVMQGALQTPGGLAEVQQKHYPIDTVPTPFSRDFSVDTVSLVFTNSPGFIDPTPLSYGNTTADSEDLEQGAARFPAATIGKDVAGIYLGKFKYPDYRVDSQWSTNVTIVKPTVYMSDRASTHPNTLVPMDLRTQYQDAEGNWRTYWMAPTTRYLTHAFDDPSGPVSAPFTNNNAFAAIEYANPDPRDSRFGLTADHAEANNTEDPVYATYRSDYSHARNATVTVYTGPPVTFSSGRIYPGYFADNISVNATNLSYYKDLDGIGRPGDGAGRSLPVGLSAVAGTSRPLILNAPFHSVADLGYTFRDMPWRSLDFFSANSADAGLLDLFTLSGGVTNSVPVVAGKININSASAPVLQALLNNAMTDFSSDLKTVDTGNVLTAADVTALVSALRPTSGTSPIFVNKADLVSFFATNMPATYKNKGQREAPIRALADLSQTRTWNLLIDVVAQAGRYAPGASNVNQFVVEGEKHYWLQVAIDRFTGEIVDQQLEPVYEQ